jgi:hypothetical protein
MLRVKTSVIMDPVDAIVGELPRHSTGKKMDLMSFGRQRCR